MKNFTLISLVSLLVFASSSFAQPGSLDSSFSVDGKATTKGPGGTIAINTNGKIVGGGTYDNGSNQDIFLVMYLASGRVDNTFGVNGKVITDFGNHEILKSVIFQPNGKILVTGYTGYDIIDPLVVRYNKNGTLDSSFGNNGKIITHLGADNIGYAIAVQPDNKILVAGEWDRDYLLLRYLANGKPDDSFGSKGVVRTSIDVRDNGKSIILQPDGKIVVAGASNSGYPGDENSFSLARYKPDGSLDTDFGDNGKVLTYVWTDGSLCNSAAIQSNGKFVTAGSDPYSGQSVMLRYTTTGKLDSSFGTNGIANIPNSLSCSDKIIAIQTDDKIVVSGSSGGNFLLMRYKPNGSLDKSFGVNGKVVTDFGGNDRGYSVAIQADGKIVQSGESRGNFAIARFKEDNNFNNSNSNFSGLQKKHILPDVYLSPNPVKNVLHIQGLSANGRKTISIINVYGKLLQRTVTANTAYSTDVKTLATGMYYIGIEENNKITRLKFIKE